MGNPIKLSADDMAAVEPLDETVSAGPVRLSADDMADVEPLDETPPQPEQPVQTERPGVLSRVGSSVLEGVKSFGRGVKEAGDLISPITSRGELHVPFSQLADPAYRRNIERGLSTGITLGAAEQLGKRVDSALGAPSAAGTPTLAGTEAADLAAAPRAIDLGQAVGSGVGPVARASDALVGLAGKGLGRVASGALGRSDRRLLDSVAEGALAKQRRAIQQDQADVIDVMRSDPELLRAAKAGPADLVEATKQSLQANSDAANKYYSQVVTDPAELATLLRKRQDQLRQSLSTQDVADAMEGQIKSIESRVTERPSRSAVDRPAKGESSGPNPFDELDDIEPYSPAERRAFQQDLRRYHGGEIHGLTDAPVGSESATSEAATAAQPVRRRPAPKQPVPEKSVSGPAGTDGRIDGRDLRQYVTNRQGEATNLVPGTKPTPSHQAQSEIANTLRDYLHSQIADASPDALDVVRELDRRSSALVRLNKAAQYKAANTPGGNGSRLSAIGRGITDRAGQTLAAGALLGGGMTGHAGAGVGAAIGAMALPAAARWGARTADEAIAAIVRASRAGAVPTELLDQAVKLGVRPAVIQSIVSNMRGQQ